MTATIRQFPILECVDLPYAQYEMSDGGINEINVELCFSYNVVIRFIV